MNFKFFNKKNLNNFKRMKLLKQISPNNGYSILRSSKTLDYTNEILLEMAQECDEYSYMSEELGTELDSLFTDDNYVIGIHRTGYTYMNDQMINEYFTKGLINNNHSMQGVVTEFSNIENTVTVTRNITFLIGQLKLAHNYKGSQGCMIVKIPKCYLNRPEGELRSIYYDNGTTLNLLPEFIYGYIPVDLEGNLGPIIYNPNYSDEHHLNNESVQDNSTMHKR